MEKNKKTTKTAKKTTKVEKTEVVKTPKPVKVIDEKVFAIVEINKQQEKVREGEELMVDLLKEDNLTFDKVLMYTDGKDVKFGTPYLKDAKVVAKKLADVRGEKIRIETFKAKSRYRRARGHRQPKSKILIETIVVK